MLTATADGERAEFVYDGKVLDHVEVYEGSFHTMTLRFIHDKKGRISRIEADNYMVDDLDKCRLGVLRLMAGEQMGKLMCATAARASPCKWSTPTPCRRMPLYFAAPKHHRGVFFYK